MRVDGKFMVGNDIPDGQANIIELLEECFEMLHDLKIEIDEEEQQHQEPSNEEVPQVGVAA